MDKKWGAQGEGVTRHNGIQLFITIVQNISFSLHIFNHYKQRVTNLVKAGILVIWLILFFKNLNQKCKKLNKSSKLHYP